MFSIFKQALLRDRRQSHGLTGFLRIHQKPTYNTCRGLPFKPQGMLSHLGKGTGYLFSSKKLFVTEQLIQWINSINVLED